MGGDGRLSSGAIGKLSDEHEAVLDELGALDPQTGPHWRHSRLPAPWGPPSSVPLAAQIRAFSDG